MSGIQSEIKAGDVKNIGNIISPDGSVKGTSLPDVKDQEIKKVGVAPVRSEMQKSPSEKADDEYDGLFVSDFSRSVMRDANSRAIKLTSLDGFPE